jgi:hypothetical protein
VVIRESATYFGTRKAKSAKKKPPTTPPDDGAEQGDDSPGAVEGELLADGLATLRLGRDALLLCATVTRSPEGKLADLVATSGELRFLPLPETPKPWEDVRVSPAQRAVLASVVRRVAPTVAASRETLDALCEAHGFRPRALAQAAARLVLAGDISADAARAQSGTGDLTPKNIEDALMARSPKDIAKVLAGLDSGTALTTWYGDTVDGDRLGGFLVPFLSKLFRQALAMRTVTERAGLGDELDRDACAVRGWYGQSFTKRILPRLQESLDAEDTFRDKDKRKASPWQLHRVFRLAAAHSSSAMLEALGGLAKSGADRIKGRTAIPPLTAVLLTCLAHRPPAAVRKTR